MPVVVGAPQLKRYTAYRQPVRRLPGRGLPDRPASGDEPPSGDAHGGGGPAPPPRGADRPAGRPGRSRGPGRPRSRRRPSTGRWAPDPACSCSTWRTRPPRPRRDGSSGGWPRQAGASPWARRASNTRCWPNGNGSASRPAAPRSRRVGAVERLAVVSGSCSPTTEAQIRAALADGFEGMALDPRDLIGPQRDAVIATGDRGRRRDPAARTQRARLYGARPEHRSRGGGRRHGRRPPCHRARASAAFSADWCRQRGLRAPSWPAAIRPATPCASSKPSR